MSHYKAFDHQHLGEIHQSVNQLQSSFSNELLLFQTEVILQENFATLYTTVEESLEELVTIYETFIKISLCNGNNYKY
jgi:N-acetyl-gamma-glutamyl-phosphate reductase